MILNTRTARPGITLLEVLTAIFIMGVGLLALLTLFPLGALNMARAVRDDRAANIAGLESSLATALDLRNDPFVVQALTTTPPGYANPDPDGPSYPVLVDPVYFNLKAGPVGAVNGVTPGVGRITTNYVQPPGGVANPAAWQKQAIARWFTFQDEITFEKTGQPTGGGTSVNRPGTYTATYLVRRPRSSAAALTEISVIVYASRATDAPSGETTCAATALGPNSVSVTFAGDKPDIRKGAWVMDTSYRIAGNGGTVNGYCYQVAAVTDTGPTTMTLELETSLKQNVTTMVLLANVITVVDRGTTWRP
jgi:hypothetical protein